MIVAGVTLSSPDKVLWPAAGGRPAITKTDLARYYEQAAERILPHVADRPVSIIRAPDGIEGETFFQRHAMPGSNPRLKLIDVKARTPYVAAVDVGAVHAAQPHGERDAPLLGHLRATYGLAAGALVGWLVSSTHVSRLWSIWCF